MEEDAAAERLIATLAISKARDGLPAPGFFDCAQRHGRFSGDPDGDEARTLHTAELHVVFLLQGRFARQSRPLTGAADCPDPQHSYESMPGSGYPMFRNDRGVPEIRIGVREFKCIGVSPPQDHPHLYINMGEADTILFPYCATRFRFDLPCNCPQEGCDLAGDRGDRYGIAPPLRSKTSITGAQPALSFPCNLAHSRRQLLLSALVCATGR
jgi:uncharacterized Zn-finger protein